MTPKRTPICAKIEKRHLTIEAYGIIFRRLFDLNINKHVFLLQLVETLQLYLYKSLTKFDFFSTIYLQF